MNRKIYALNSSAITVDSILYAKIYYKNGKPYGETIEEHTLNLLKNFEILKRLYYFEIKENLENLTSNRFFWLLETAVLYHDLGKANDLFQRKIRKILKQSYQATSGLRREIPHNSLSPAFLPEYDFLNDKEFFMLFYAIAYHHYRKTTFDKEELVFTIKTDLEKKLPSLSWVKKKDSYFSMDQPLWTEYFAYLDEYANDYQVIKRDKDYILLKGILHRLDHSASAHLPVEEERIKETEKKLIAYLNTKDGFKGLKDFQKQAAYLRDKNVLLIASTGVGKTEFAINWIGKDKAFYTLPLRVSVNAIYERFKKVFGENHIGLLHSESALYGIEEMKHADKELSDERLSISEHLYRTDLSRQFAMPLTITTADQIFTSVFKWKGYEKIYATLMYAKVVLDEPQGYSPDTLALIIQGLQEIAQLGGKFCLMSATVHPFILQKLKDCLDCLPIECFIKDKKHRISCEDKTIEELVPDIKKAYQVGKRVLVIVNTVKKAQELFKRLKKIGAISLLHSQFIYMHRKKKENDIFNNSKPVIWITTQLVEASLDIDYDILFTELASLDSLIQRMGRVYRKRPYQSDEPNIVIAMDKPSGKGTVYDNDILKFTKEALQIYDGQFLTEEIKKEVMKQVFDIEKMKQDGVKFYKKFRENLTLLKYGFEVEDKRSARALFRNIVNITAIPTGIYNDPRYKDKIETALESLTKKKLPKEQRLSFLKHLKDFTLSLPYYKVQKAAKAELKKGIFLISIPYDETLGVVIGEELESIL